MSATGGLWNAVTNAVQIGAKAFALFTKNQRQWIAKDISDKEAALFTKQLNDSGIDARHVLPHDSYIINLGAFGDDLLQKSRSSFTAEMQRCEKLGLHLLNFHPGSAKDWKSTEACLDRVAESIALALSATKSVVAVIENTAGQGNYLGSTFEELRYLIDRIDNKERVGVCIDTCHAFAAGYDLSSADASAKVWDDFDRIVGFDKLRGMHLNDSMKPLASHVDRHESLGKGHIGLAAFERLMKDDRFDDIPLILETPNPDLWPEEIATLYSFTK